MSEQNLLQIAITAALEAGKKIMEIYETEDFGIDFKNDNSPLTKADIASHNIIESFLKQTNIPILSEEGKNIPYESRKDWSQLWIVDPIDGTKEFIKRNGDFTVNIALIENQIPVLGVIYTPVLNELFFSTKSKGAFKVITKTHSDEFSYLKENAVKLPIKSGKESFTIVASKSHMSIETEDYVKELELIHGKVELISRGSSLKLCMVAEGKADCYPRFAPTMEWDTAAGQAICMHAGFEVIDWSTQQPMLYNRENLLNNWFLVR